MTRCLGEKTLLLLSEGQASSAQRSHLRTCQKCAGHYDRITSDVKIISHTLQQEPPRVELALLRMPFAYRTVPIATALLLAVGLLWGESRLWKLYSPSSSEQAVSADVSQFLEQVSDALFDGGNIRDVEANSPESDFASLQVALGENCSDDCREFFSTALDEPMASSGNPTAGGEMQRAVSDRGE
jgi:hypothetical protein